MASFLKRPVYSKCGLSLIIQGKHIKKQFAIGNILPGGQVSRRDAQGTTPAGYSEAMPKAGKRKARDIWETLALRHGLSIIKVGAQRFHSLF